MTTIKRKNKKHNLSDKLDIVLKVIEEGQSCREVSQVTSIAYSLICDWVRMYKIYGLEGLSQKNIDYSLEQKLSVLRDMQENNLSLRATGVKYKITSSVIYKWKCIYATYGTNGLMKPPGRPSQKPMSKKPTHKKAKTREEELEEELAYLRAENAYLKKLRALVEEKKRPKAVARAKVIEELRPKYELAHLLRASGMARSSFYYHQKRFKRPDKHQDLKKAIVKIFHAHKGRYGYRRITMALRNEGHKVNHKTVQSLMRICGIKSLVRLKKYRSYKGNIGKIAPNLLERDFHASQPNQKWVTDVTEFSVQGKKLYLSPIMDLYNREIVSYSILDRPVFNMVTQMLDMAFKKLPDNTGLILHSDQGWQYQMRKYQKLLEKKGIRQSMSRKGNCLDNAAMENFFGLLKSELFYLRKFNTTDELLVELEDYIYYYNNFRIKEKLKGLSPIQFRTQSLTA